VDINLRELIESIVKNVSNVEVTIKGDKTPVVQGEIESIRRLFVNLINNSIEAMHDKGKLKITLRRHQKYLRAVLHNQTAGNRARFVNSKKDHR